MAEIPQRDLFGDWLRRKRKASDLSQEQLAIKAVCSIDTIRKIESGERKASRDMARSLLVALKVPEADMPAIIALARLGNNAGDDEKPSPAAIVNAPLLEAPAVMRANLHLPAQRSTFIGRAQEIDRIESLLLRADTGVVTITGSPGIGKTRLAIQVASKLQSRFPDGIYFVELASVLHHNEVLPAVARALRVETASADLVVDILKEALAIRQVLLVLDNFEHVIEGRLALSDISASCSSLKMLVTSRRSLKIYGECEYRVPSLTVPGPLVAVNAASALAYEAPRLFVERATLLDPLFQITDENAPIIVEICRRLDALPLAIELAAGRSRVLGPRAILSRLSSRMNLLNTGGQDLAPRQQTLRGAIEWSYSLLDPNEAALFRRMSVFASGATLDAIQKVCLGWGIQDAISSGIMPDALDATAALLDASLLERVDDQNGEPRFRMLATVREYAEAMLEACGEVEETRSRLSTYHLNLVERVEPSITSSNRDAFLRQVDFEYDNIIYTLTKSEKQPHAALRIAGSLGWYWYFRGLFPEGRSWLEMVIGWARGSKDVQGAAAPDDSAEMAKALLAAAWLANNQADLPKARAFAEASVEIYDKLQEQKELGLALSILGITVVLQSEVEAGHGLLEKAVFILRQSDDAWSLAFGLSCLADSFTWFGDYETASHLYEESLSLYQRLGDRWGISEELQSLGGILLQNGKYAEAIVRLEHSLAFEQELGSKRNRALILYNIGYALFSMGMHEQASVSFEDALATFRELRMARAACGALRHLIYLQQIAGNIKGAIELGREYDGYQRGLANKRTSLLYMRAVACLAAGSGVAAQAARLFAFIESEQQADEPTLTALDQGFFSRCLTSTKSSMQPGEWAEAGVIAGTLDLDKAIDYASYLLTLCSLSAQI